MSDKGSVFQKGGGGTNFEQAVQTAFLTTLIIRGNAPLSFHNEIIEVAFQTTNRGWQTDDLLIIAKSAIGTHQLLVQIKNNLIFSINNEKFKEVMYAFWRDYKNPNFNKDKDKLYVIKGHLNQDEKNHLKSLLNWAKTHANESDFLSEVNRIKAKKEKLDIFINILKEINDNTLLTDKEIWEFLKCLDVLEFDFTEQNSVDEIYFLNLLKLCKNNETTSNEKEIWDSIYAFVSKLNPNGGSVTRESIQKDEIYRHFDIEKLNPYFKSVEKLKSDSNAILTPLKNTIHGFHLDRKEIRQTIIESVNNFQFTIVTGKPGVGKSAIIKDILENDFPSASVFVFRADQFNEPHIANVFSRQGVNEALQDIFSCISLIPEKIIFIDSLEKLLETDPECAFKQLLFLSKEYPDIKIIGSSRKYAIDLITQKFDIDIKELGIVEILPLDDSELKVIVEQFPQLNQVLKNAKIKQLLQSPKYLDFAILALNKSNEDYTDISLKEFKNKLWNSLVVNNTNTKNGLPNKREKAFLEIAVNRAKEMQLFTKPVNADAEAIALLENDEIIFQEKQNRRYSPTHDILEDWALVRYVSSIYEDNARPNELFEKLGTEPAIRRAFRLWIEDCLVDESFKINELIKETLLNTEIEDYWVDELLIAVFRAENCSAFFKTFENELIENNADLLNRCINLIKTGCKESILNYKNVPILYPIGSGWTEVLIFTSNNISKFDSLRFSICNFLFDWEYKIFLNNNNYHNENLAVKIITIHYLYQIESGITYWQKDGIKGIQSELVSLLFNLSHIAKSEITELVERSFINKEDEDSWKLKSFYKIVINKCLSGIRNENLIKELPELIILTAWEEWKIKKKEEITDNSISSFMRSYRTDDSECWGIQVKFSFFPSGIYKTPLYYLLKYHPNLGLKFIVEFINYSIEYYIKTDCNYKHDFFEIEIELKDGTKVKQWAGWELWSAYRGLSVTHYAIESLLMSLEKYLLEIAEIKSERSKKSLHDTFNYLLQFSNNISVVGVLTSISIAYPDEVGDAFLPLLSVKEFYKWDLNRALQETLTLAPYDDNISFAQDERWKSNHLPHRRKYYRGLRDFILDYQFINGKLNKEIHQEFDKLKSKNANDDILWTKTLIEIDIRNTKIGDYDKEIGGYPILPVYDKKVSEYLESIQEEMHTNTESMNYAWQLQKAFEAKEIIDFSLWEKSYTRYSTLKSFNIIQDRPVTLAVLGLRDYLEFLNDEQKEWCFETIVNTIQIIIQETNDKDYSVNLNYSLIEKDIALFSFHLLFPILQNENNKEVLITLILQMLIATFAEYEVDKIIEYMRNNFFRQYPEEAKRIWLGLIKYSIFRKANPLTRRNDDKKDIEFTKQKETKFIKDISTTNDTIINLSEINFENCDANIIARAFVITPYFLIDEIYSKFIIHFIYLMIEDFKYKEDHSWGSEEKERQINFNSRFDIEFFLTELFVYADKVLSKQVLDLIIKPILTDDIQFKRRDTGDLFKFVSDIIKNIILKLYEILANSNDECRNNQLIENFWNVWEYLFEKIQNSNQLDFTSILLLNISWEPNSNHWKALEGKKDFYHKMVKVFGILNTQSILNVFSTIGEKTFLPEGISWLVEVYKEENKFNSLASQSAVRLINRLFYNHISEIKNNKILIDDYIWILNRMVDLGSSEAYFIRENVISYKKLS